MPLFRIGNDFHYYAHVPKCAGTSVEAYLEKRFGTLGFVNRRFLWDAEETRWPKSSPQHVPFDVFTQLFPREWIASSFAIVRHPVKRLVSAFQYQLEVENTVAGAANIDEFFDDWLARRETEPFLYDCHLRPQVDIMTDDTVSFRMEDGFDAMIAHLDVLAGDKKGPRDVPAENVRPHKISRDDPRMQPSEATLDKVAQYYAEDFRRFGYKLNEIPKSKRPPEKKRSFVKRVAKAALNNARRK